METFEEIILSRVIITFNQIIKPENMKLFIDANVYLPFYNSNAIEFRKLLKTLDEVKSDIIITEQIVNEVIRNRFNMFKGSFDNYAKQAKVVEMELPLHILSSMDKELKEWNKQRKKLTTDSIEPNNLFKTIRDKALIQVYEGNDDVSNTLDKIFKKAIKPNKKERDEALFRLNTGNPPGKNSDPLGDQLNWTILLNKLKGVSKIWIVTKDNDFCIEWNNKERKLNPFLHRELKTKHPKLEVELHDDLSTALDSYGKARKKKIQNLPTDATMRKIEREEQAISGSNEQHIVAPAYTTPLFRIKRCPVCNKFSDHILIGGSMVTGTLSKEYQCMDCKTSSFENVWREV